MVTTVNQQYSVEVSEDGMRAWIKCTRRKGYADTTCGEIVALLEEHNIAVDDQVATKIQEFVSQVKEKGPYDHPFEIACGRPAMIGTDARLLWNDDFRRLMPPQAKTQADPDFYDLESFIILEPDTVIGKLEAKVDGHDGLDVYGHVLPACPVPRNLEVGEGLQLDEDSHTVTTSQGGKLQIQNGVLSVTPCEVIDGDVDGKRGDIQSSQALCITGSVKDDARITSDKSITIYDAVELATIKAGNDVIIGGGISGENRTTITAGGRIVARFCTNASLKADHDVRLLTSANSCRIHSMGRIIATDGMIIGGESYARNGVTARIIGSKTGGSTILRVGIHPDALRSIANKEREIEEIRESVEKIRKATEPLASQMKRLTAQQREQVTELLYKADNLEHEIDRCRQEQEKVMNQFNPDMPSCIEVDKRVYSGTLVVVNEYQASIDEDLIGPLTITLKNRSGKGVIVATHKNTGEETILKTKPVALEGKS